MELNFTVTRLQFEKNICNRKVEFREKKLCDWILPKKFNDQL